MKKPGETKVKRIAENDNDILMEMMRDTVDLQHGPKVGMFWYNPERDILVGVHSAFVSEFPFNAKGRKTVQTLHHTAWPSVRKSAIALGSPDKIWEEEDYTLVPRGCIFQIEVPGSNEEYFEVLIGSWINDYPNAKALIVEEFNLRDADF